MKKLLHFIARIKIIKKIIKLIILGALEKSGQATTLGQVSLLQKVSEWIKVNLVNLVALMPK